MYYPGQTVDGMQDAVYAKAYPGLCSLWLYVNIAGTLIQGILKKVIHCLVYVFV